MRNSFRKKGFTLPEVLIVLAIISILAFVSIPIFQGFADNGKIQELKADLIKLATSQENYYSAKGRFASRIEDLEKFGYVPPVNNKKSFFTGVIIDEDLGMKYWVAGNYKITTKATAYAECWVYLGENIKTGEDDPFVNLYNENKSESRELTCAFCPKIKNVCKYGE
ncbi:MAG TPA: prepilin-type N-terminal cleavage/methylation domain-containing protein [bacterium]|nr:prepilin-type N-terminal cleavage/methylation domain-containing protein [bacterium]HQM86157.1 prepilin-type N-terminal cleavage/methylation domain-containing protein [bacterium]